MAESKDPLGALQEPSRGGQSGRVQSAGVPNWSCGAASLNALHVPPSTISLARRHRFPTIFVFQISPGTCPFGAGHSLQLFGVRAGSAQPRRKTVFGGRLRPTEALPNSRWLSGAAPAPLENSIFNPRSLGPPAG